MSPNNMLATKRSAGVAPEVNLKNSLHTLNPGQTSPEVQNRGISDPTNRTDVLQIILKNKQLNLSPNAIPGKGAGLIQILPHIDISSI